MRKSLHFLVTALLLCTVFNIRAAVITPDFREGELCYKITDTDAQEVQIACPGRFESSTYTRYSFESITLPTSVTHDGVTYTVTGICESGISGNKNLKSITIPAGYELGQYAFSDCSALTTVVLPEDVVCVTSSANGYSSGNQFQGCSSLTSINIPSGWTEIPGYFLSDCTSLTSVNIPDGVETIGYSAFQNAGLTSLNLPTAVKVIHQQAFNKCKNLTGDLTLHEGITTMGRDAFADCTSLTSISVPASLTTMDMGIFDGCTNVATITMAEGLKEIGEHMFADCDKVTSITIPSSVEKIGSYAFYGLANLTEINWPEECKITEIPEACFRMCSGLEGIDIPTSVTKIGHQAYYQTYMTDIVIPGHVMEVVKSIYDSANFSATNSVTVEYNENPLAIGTNEFNCKYLTIDRNITEKSAFNYNNLTELTIGEHVTALPDFNCRLAGLKKNAGAQIVLLATTPPSIPTTSFDDTYYSTVKVIVPEGSIEAYAAHEVWGKFINLAKKNPRWESLLSVVGEGTSEAVLEVSWGDGKAIDNLVSGVRHSGSTVSDVIKAALAGDPRFYGLMIGTDFVAFGFDTNGDQTSGITLNGSETTMTDGLCVVNGDYTGAASSSEYDHWQLNSSASAWQVYVDGQAAAWDSHVNSGADITLVYTERGTSEKPEPEYTFNLHPADEIGVWMTGSYSAVARKGSPVPMLANWGANGTATSYSFEYTDSEGNSITDLSLSVSNAKNGNVVATVNNVASVGKVYVKARGYINKQNTEYSDPCELTLFVENPVTGISLAGIEDGATIEIDPMGVLQYTPVFEPEDADLQTFTVTYSDESLITDFVTAKKHFFVAHGAGETTVTFTSGDGNASKTYNVVVKGYDTEVPADNYQEGVIWLNEEWFGHTSGSLNYISKDLSDITYRAYEAQNEGKAFGCTSQFGTIWGDKLIVMSKQAWDHGDTRADSSDPGENGGRVVIADAKTMKRIASFNEIGGDGRAAVGVTPDKVYLTHSKGVRVLDLSTMTLADSDIAGLEVDRNGQMGNITVSGKYAFAVATSQGIHIIDTTDDTYVKTISDKKATGIVTTADGKVWYSAGKVLTCINPETLEVERSVNLPSAVPANQWAWTNVCLFANPNKNEIIWGNGTMYRWNIDEVEDPSTLEPVYTYVRDKSEGGTDYGNPYGSAGYDPRNDVYMFASLPGYGISALENYLHFVDATTGEVKEVKELPQYWWFPAMPITPDQYSAELAVEDQVFESDDTEARTFNISELVSDRDNINKLITYSILDGTDAAVATADLTDGVLTITPVAPGETTVTLALTSNGRTVNHVINVKVKYTVPENLYIFGDIDGSNSNTPPTLLEMSKNENTFTYTGTVLDVDNGYGYFAFTETWEAVNATRWSGAEGDDQQITVDTPAALQRGADASLKLAAGRYDFTVTFSDYEVVLTVSEATESGVDGIYVDFDADAEYYDLQGVRVNNPAPGNIYIVRRGNTVTKEYVK